MSWHLLETFFSPVTFKVHLQIQTPFIILPDWLHDENAATKHKHFFMPNSEVRYDYKNIPHKRNHTFFPPFLQLQIQFCICCSTKMYCLEKSRLKNRISHMYYWKTCDKAFLSSQINFEWYISSLRVGS